MSAEQGEGFRPPFRIRGESHLKRSLAVILLPAVLCAAVALQSSASHAAEGRSATVVWIVTKDGKSLEGELVSRTLEVLVNGKRRALRPAELLSVHTADPASATESQRIAAGIAAVMGPDRKARDAAVADLTEIGLPAVTPVLASYKDTDAREPNPHYHLFARLMPGYADALDRTRDLIRLANGTVLRGELQSRNLTIKGAHGTEKVPVSSIRRLAIRREKVERVLDVQALRHCTQIEFLDTGVSLTSASRVKQEARGWVRLDFNKDGWSSDPDGLKVPGPNYKTNLVDGHPFGALVGKVGASGSRWFAGRHLEKSGLGTGRLYLAINDNPHWQNNIGSFRVTLRATDAYDLGDPN